VKEERHQLMTRKDLSGKRLLKTVRQLLAIEAKRDCQGSDGLNHQTQEMDGRTPWMDGEELGRCADRKDTTAFALINIHSDETGFHVSIRLEFPHKTIDLSVCMAVCDDRLIGMNQDHIQ